MLKTLKNAKRRVVESVLESVGAADRTVDEEFDLFHQRYTAMMVDMNECGAANHSALSNQKSSFADNLILAETIWRIHDHNQKSSFADNLILAETIWRIHDQYRLDDYWPGAPCNLSSIPAAEKYKEAMKEIHTIYRSSSALTCLERAIDPLREAIANITPNVDSLVKERNTQVIDYDSYRRRLKGLREKYEQLEAQGKAQDKAGQELQAEIAKFQGKEHVAKESYNIKNATVKDEIVQAKEMHDELINSVLISTVVSQAELYAAAAKKLEEVIKLLPADKVEETRAQVRKIVAQGGVIPPKEEKTNMQKGLAILTGKALPSDFKKKDEAAEAGAGASAGGVKGGATKQRSASMFSLASTSKAASATATTSTTPKATAAGNPFATDGNPFTAEDTTPSAPPPPPSLANRPTPPPPAPPAPPAAAKKMMVVALYDHEAEADDELNFKAGEKVEVLETSDDGWWKGKVGGRVGLFPVNYVEVEK
eukprot:gene28539-34450_t